MLLDLSIELRLILSITTSLLLALLLKYPIHYVAIKKECLEKENGRTSHKGKIPNLGGAIIYFSFLTSSLLFVKFAAVKESPTIPYSIKPLLKSHNENEAIINADNPEHKPSIPSIRFIAFTMPSIIIIVNGMEKYKDSC